MDVGDKNNNEEMTALLSSVSSFTFFLISLYFMFCVSAEINSLFIM